MNDTDATADTAATDPQVQALAAALRSHFEQAGGEVPEGAAAAPGKKVPWEKIAGIVIKILPFFL